MPPIAFFSYAHADNEHSNDKLRKLCLAIQEEVNALEPSLGFEIFLDRDHINWGDNWKRVIEKRLDTAAFLIPVYSPQYFASEWCKKELNAFLERQSRLLDGSGAEEEASLIHPLLYLDLPQTLTPTIETAATDPQWIDIRYLSNFGARLQTKKTGDLIRTMATRLVSLSRTHQLAPNRAAKEVLAVDQLATIAETLLEASSSLLLYPTTLPGDRWLDRPELATILKACLEQAHSATLVIGGPGSGKSAFLSKLATKCRESNLLVLGIKADVLKTSVSNLDSLSEHVLGRPGNLVADVLYAAKTRKVVVILDQLDALADLADLRSSRLDVLLSFMNRLSSTANVHLVCSSREYEMRHDYRLNGLTQTSEAKRFTEVSLAPLTPEQVLGELATKRIDASQWPPGQLAFLATPYHLKLFLQQINERQAIDSPIPEQSLFASIHAIHQQRWRDTISAPPNSSQKTELLNRLAEHVRSEECFRVPVAQFDDLVEAVDELEKSDWITCDSHTIGFAHQTQFEFVLARQFVSDPDAFADHVRERQHGLFVRPTVWHTLNYSRMANFANYWKMVSSLLALPPRPHLQILMMDFFAQLDDPRPEEVRTVSALLESPSTYDSMGFRLRGREGWYRVLSPYMLPALMSRPTETCWQTARIIQYAWPFAFEENKDLIRTNWIGQGGRLQLVWEVVEAAPRFDDEMVDWLCAAASAFDTPRFHVTIVAKKVSQTLPDQAPRLLAVALNRQLEKIETDSPRWHTALEGREWHDVEKLAELAPRAFLDEIWPKFCQALEQLSPLQTSRLATYQQHAQCASWFHGKRPESYPLPNAIRIAIEEVARSDSKYFAEFVEKYSQVNSFTVQQLLAIGLVQCGARTPSLSYEFLVGDFRRLLLGNFRNSVSTTMALIAAASPGWSQEQRDRFRQYVLTWNPYRVSATPEEDEIEFAVPVRERLLHALSTGNRNAGSGVTSIRTKAEGPELSEDSPSDNWEWQQIESPILATVIVRMSDLEIVNAFDLVHDGTDHRHPIDWRMGGSVQASDEFQKFVKEHPVRGINIIRQFRSGAHERPAGSGLIALAEINYDGILICGLVRHLVATGFNQPNFRDDVGVALEKVAFQLHGLPDDICQLLSQWLLDPDNFEANLNNIANINESEFGSSHSIIWDHGNPLVPIPNRLFWLGISLKDGYCLRQPQQSGLWLKFLADMVERPFSADVWCAWVWDLATRYVPDRRALAPIVAQLLLLRYDVLMTVPGIRALAHFSMWLDESTQSDLLNRLASDGLDRAQQAVGELTGLFALRDQNEECLARIEGWLQADPDDESVEASRVGLAFAAANQWTVDEYRPEAAVILSRLTTAASVDVRHAVLHAFFKDNALKQDAPTRSFLQALASNFDFAAAGEGYWVSKRLADFANTEPELVLGVCQRIVASLRSAGPNNEFWYAGADSTLISIALTLHRNQDREIRIAALSLFEDLMEIASHEASNALRTLDQRPISTT